jgi:hypothetical protein
MKLTKTFVAVSSALALAATPLFAGTKTFKETVVIEEEPSSWYNAALSTGYDSLYMFRGTNVLRDGGYGNGLWWTDANFTWNITDNDFLTVGGWMAFGLGNAVPGYRELNVYTNYVHTFGDLAVGLGYTFYFTFPNSGQGYANELNASVAYDIDLGFMTLTPSVTYFFNLGPDADTNSGLVDVASSYLDLRLDGSIPVIADVVSIDPWVAFGLNFGYNLNGNGNTFNGANNLEFGVAVPWQVNEVITLAAYGAYSYAFQNLWGTTQRNTFWGGANVTFAF